MYRLRLLKIRGSKLCLPQGPPTFPDTLRYLYWNSYPLKSLPTNFIAEKLVELDMRGSQLEILWEGAPNLVNLKHINLSESMHLTQVPDISRALNVKSVNLWFCARLTEVPSYFQLLTELKILSLIGCPSLSKLSGLPKSLTKLRVLTKPFEHDMSNCRARRNCCSSKLERFPRILEPMEFLEYLRLEFAAIKELPLSIKNLTGLKLLSLRFCQNLEFLPDNIHSLSSLQELDIGFCRKLESLPELPSSLTKLDARFCTSLKTMSSSIPLVKQNWDDFFNEEYYSEEFIFLGCEMLDENARRVIMNEALFRVLRLATLYSKYGSDRSKFDLRLNRSFWPGSEIPRWFSHKSDESSICINLPHPDCWYNSSSYLGLVFCLVLEFHDPMLTPNDHWQLYVHGESVYMFPNGDLWKQRERMSSYISFHYHYNYISDSCSFSYDNTNEMNIDGALRFEYLYVFMDNTYGEFLRSNNGQIDSHGNKFPRTATVDFQDSEAFGEYIKLAEEGRCDDANGITGFTSPTAAASFFFSLDEKYEKLVKIKKCGVHLLYTQEADRFGYVRQIVSESSGDHEAVYSSEESDQEDQDEE
ncbi:hypothetical protein TIFTF001_029603 [Ficus carica]|uniref:C-JID domain-containing protein n=1 Tax=Ficus carica TaxID=3494 RepID=A0AA88DSC3_FICCA|nr:hypothetical protein TIFTF001_029603 [Ficus carica]